MQDACMSDAYILGDKHITKAYHIDYQWLINHTCARLMERQLSRQTDAILPGRFVDGNANQQGFYLEPLPDIDTMCLSIYMVCI